MGDITYSLPNSDVVADHKFNVVINLVEAGIKLFLHQRNQIPVPMERLSREEKEVEPSQFVRGLPSSAANPVHKFGFGANVVDHIGAPAIGHQQLSTARKLPPDYVDPRIKIRSLLGSRRKKMLDKLKTDMEKNRIRRESHAFDSLTNLLKMMKVECASLPVPLQAVALVLGPSLAFPKEVIVFDFKSVNFNDKREILPREFPAICRSYYKSIIMSDAFMELTDTSLFPTKAAVYIFVKEKIPNKVGQKLLLVDGNQWIEELFKPENIKMKTFRKIQGPQRKIMRKKRNIIRICINDSGNGSAAINDKTNHNDSPISEDEIFIPPNNSFCYQIPSFFKGLQCKKKQ